MILLLGGTTESIQIAKGLEEQGLSFILSTATEYGGKIAREKIQEKVIEGRMTKEEMKLFCKQNQIMQIVDATHPYAQIVSAYAMEIAKEEGILYYRYERESKVYEKARVFASYEEMGTWLNQKEGNILVTTGSKEIDKLTKVINNKQRLFVRILPVSEPIQKLEKLGFLPRQILAMQGPFDVDLNKAMLKKINASYLVTKESGKAGRVEEKIKAAKEMGVEVLLLKRPKLSYPNVFEDEKKLIEALTQKKREDFKVAILTLTPGGVKQGLRLKEHFQGAHLYTKKELKETGCFALEEGFQKQVGKVFENYSLLVFIMASGIVVRSIAPYLKHKAVDPAILVMDEKGQFVISLLSGHIGGANFYAEKVAKCIGATPVLTTASDVNGILAIDMLAKKLECSLVDFEGAKQLMAKKLKGERIVLDTTMQIPKALQKDYPLYQEGEKAQGIIYIGEEKPKDYEVPFTWLIPKRWVVGIGCKKGKSYEEIKKTLERVFHKVQIPVEGVACLATIEIKKEEEGLVKMAKALGVPLIAFSVEEIKQVQDKFGGSDFVEKTVGVRAVSEPAGYLASNKGECLLSVQKMEGITVSVWERDPLFVQSNASFL